VPFKSILTELPFNISEICGYSTPANFEAAGSVNDRTSNSIKLPAYDTFFNASSALVTMPNRLRQQILSFNLLFISFLYDYCLIILIHMSFTAKTCPILLIERKEGSYYEHKITKINSLDYRNEE